MIDAATEATEPFQAGDISPVPAIETFLARQPQAQHRA